MSETSCQVAIIDLVLEDLPYHAYRIDFEPAFQAMFRKFDGKKHKYLYLNSSIASSDGATSPARHRPRTAGVFT